MGADDDVDWPHLFDGSAPPLPSIRFRPGLHRSTSTIPTQSVLPDSDTPVATQVGAYELGNVEQESEGSPASEQDNKGGTVAAPTPAQEATVAAPAPNKACFYVNEVIVRLRRTCSGVALLKLEDTVCSDQLLVLAGLPDELDLVVAPGWVLDHITVPGAYREAWIAYQGIVQPAIPGRYHPQGG